jgi:hypothetical protein
MVEACDSNDMVFGLQTEYVVEISGKWFRVRHAESHLYDPSTQDSDNVCKWDSYGNHHDFTIVECEPPTQDLPVEVQEFVERYLVTGSKHAELRVHHKGENAGTHPSNTPPVDAVEGWSDLPPVPEYSDQLDDENHSGPPSRSY